MLLKGSHRSDRKEKNKWILMSFAGEQGSIPIPVTVSSAHTSTNVVVTKEKKKEQMQELVDKAKVEVLASNERLQSEWVESHICSCGKILRMGMDVIEHKCKNCGRWSIKWARTIPDSFCSNCGAKIKNGGAK